MVWIWYKMRVPVLAEHLKPSCLTIYVPVAEMRLDTTIALALTVALAISMRCCETARLRGLSLTEEEEDVQPRHFYREYGLLRSRAARADDSFDDYGHLRFGRRAED